MGKHKPGKTDWVRDQIERRGVKAARVLAAMRSVPRELFVPEGQSTFAYEDTPLPIGSGQTISQPFIVAYMIEALGLKGGEKVLEIGAGSGYAAAVLSKIASEVFAIERIGALAEFARANLARANCKNVQVRHADGTMGWIEEAPFDAILVSAGAPQVPMALAHQLKTGGCMVVPAGSDPRSQSLFRVKRSGGGTFAEERLTDVRFVPLIGKEGWDGSTDANDGNKPPTG